MLKLAKLLALALALALPLVLAGCPELTDKEDDPSGCESHSDCADTLPCTSDRCGSDGACLNTVAGDWCQINGQCVAGKAANPSNSCEVCAPLVSPKAWSAVPDGASCDDGLACTFDDRCSVGACAGTNYSCDDKLDCTIDSCTGLTPLATKGCTHDVKAGTCLIAGACVSSGAKDAQNSCNRCDPATSKTDWSAVACCGDGTKDVGEQCDLSDLNSMTCVKLGFASGGLTCKSDCSVDTSGCAGASSSGSCGNGALDYGEVCDGTKLGGMTCAGLGYDPGGTLKCTAYCTYNLGTCLPPSGCGNSILQSGEQCDKTKLGGQTCALLGFTAGTLGCLPNCTFDYSLCSQCGNKVKEGGEQCDGAVTGATCLTQGYNAGVLGCAAGTCTYDASGCGWALGVGDKPDSISAVAVDAAGYVYVAGNFKTSITLGTTTHPASGKSLFVAKLDPSGKVLWSATGTGGAEVRSIAVAGGSVYVTGSVNGTGVEFGPTIKVSTLSALGDQILVAQLGTGSGTFSWATSFGEDAVGHGVAVSPLGDVFVTGQFESGVPGIDASGMLTGGFASKGSTDLFVLKLASSGQLLSSIALGGAGEDGGEALTFDGAGNVLVTGYYKTAITGFPGSGPGKVLLKPKGGTDLVVLKYNASLAMIWAATAGSTDDDRGTGIVHSGGVIHLVGTIKGSATLNTQQTPATGPFVTAAGEDLLVASMGSNGVFTWGVAVAGAGEEPGALALGPAGKLHLSGQLTAPATFGSTTLSPTSGKAFIARLNAGGGFDWAKNFGDQSSIAQSVAVSSAGHVFATGAFHPKSAGSTFGATTLKTNQTFILKVAKP